MPWTLVSRSRTTCPPTETCIRWRSVVSVKPWAGGPAWGTATAVAHVPTHGPRARDDAGSDLDADADRGAGADGDEPAGTCAAAAAGAGAGTPPARGAPTATTAACAPPADAVRASSANPTAPTARTVLAARPATTLRRSRGRCAVPREVMGGL
ncbi:hypothetical protein GCM10009867_02400 [Pedococcus aerophilus]|uniref:Uncharacterized protein n=1 Tax=Pedococcus aerophilus TaxID=436356 RepID=A0ABP6GU87_9MICO